MEVITLYRGEEEAHVERGSQAEHEMRAIGFGEKEAKAEDDEKPKRGRPRTK